MAGRPTRPMIHRNRTSEGSFQDEHMTRNSRAAQSTRDSRRQRSTSVRTSSPEGQHFPFACPYSKHDAKRYSHKNVDEQDYRNCSSGYWTSIGRLKQHLYRTHDRSERCCPQCWQKFQNDEPLRRHIEAWDCQPRAMPEEKMNEEQHQRVKERIQGRPIESWYKIYHTLFPSDNLPPTPYAEWVTGDDLRACFAGLSTRLPALLLAAAAHMEPGLRNVAITPDTIFPTCKNVIQRALEICQEEFGRAMNLSRIFEDEPPTFSSSFRSTPTQARHPHDVSSGDEYEDHSSDMSYHTMPASMGQPPYQNIAYTSAGYHAATAAHIEAGAFDTFEMQEDMEGFSDYGVGSM